MFLNITFYPILGKPLIMYMGILVLLFFFLAGYFGWKFRKTQGKSSIKTHLLFAKIALILGLLHAIFGVLAFF